MVSNKVPFLVLVLEYVLNVVKEEGKLKLVEYSYEYVQTEYLDESVKAVACIDAFPVNKNGEQIAEGYVVARVFLSKNNDVIVAWSGSEGRLDSTVLSLIEEAKEDLKEIAEKDMAKEELKDALMHLRSAWNECLDIFSDARIEVNDYIMGSREEGTEYPFHLSFDELLVGEWIDGALAILAQEGKVRGNVNADDTYGCDGISDGCIGLIPYEEVNWFTSSLGFCDCCNKNLHIKLPSVYDELYDRCCSGDVDAVKMIVEMTR